MLLGWKFTIANFLLGLLMIAYAYSLTRVSFPYGRARTGRMEIAAGEYGYDTQYFRRMLTAGAVDVLQADATRCGGITGFLRAEALAEAWDVPLSAHTAPSLHTVLGCACQRVRNVEYFHDHARIEPLLFDGAIEPVDGLLSPDRSRPGVGLESKAADARQFAA